jgi:hypothetical protein
LVLIPFVCVLALQGTRPSRPSWTSTRYARSCRTGERTTCNWYHD